MSTAARVTRVENFGAETFDPQRRTLQRPPAVVTAFPAKQHEPLPFPPRTQAEDADAFRPYRWAMVLAIVIGLHAAIATVRQETTTATPPLQIVMELVRPPVPAQEIEPPKPRAAPPKIETKVEKPAPAPPRTQASLRTAPAQETVPQNAMAIPENTQAAVTAAPAVAAPPAPMQEEPASEPNAFAAYLHNPPPDYPEFAQRQGLEGKVMLRVRVSANGRAETVEIKQSSGRKAFDEAAVAAVRKWTFVPAKRGATAVDGWAAVPIEFKLPS